jgi:hypothetical protein
MGGDDDEVYFEGIGDLQEADEEAAEPDELPGLDPLLPPPSEE